MDGKAVADRLTNTCEAEQREQREAMERSLTRDEERIEVLDKMVMRLYEDMIAGRISEQNFNTMLEKTQTELSLAEQSHLFSNLISPVSST